MLFEFNPITVRVVFKSLNTFGVNLDHIGFEIDFVEPIISDRVKLVAFRQNRSTKKYFDQHQAFQLIKY